MDTKTKEFVQFMARVWEKMRVGAAEHGDGVWSDDPDKLIEDMQEECMDIVGWGFILHQRPEAMKNALMVDCKCITDTKCSVPVSTLTESSKQIVTDDGCISCYRCDALVDTYSYAPCYRCGNCYCPECINVLSDAPICDSCEADIEDTNQTKSVVLLSNPTGDQSIIGIKAIYKLLVESL